MAKKKICSQWCNLVFLLIGALLGAALIALLVVAGQLSFLQGSVLESQETIGEAASSPGILLEMGDDGSLVQTVDSTTEGIWVQMQDKNNIWVQLEQDVSAQDEDGAIVSLSSGDWVKLVDNIWVQFGGGDGAGVAKLKDGIWVQMAGENGIWVQLSSDIWVQFQEKGTRNIWVQ